jgi:hypothetical protein
MTKSSKIRDERINKAAEFARLNKNLSIAEIARQFEVPYRTLYGRVRDNKGPRSARIPANKALNQYQETALIHWITRMRDLHLPVTITMLEEWANLTVKRVDPEQSVSRSWAYRFAKRLPPHLKLVPVIQKTKEKKRLDAEDVGILQFWYNQLGNLLKGLPARLVYNFDECGFQPGIGKRQKVISTPGECPDIPESEYSENITALECIAADGWVMTPLYVFKGKKFMESWYGEELPNFYTAVSEKGYMNDQLAIDWLHKFHESTKDSSRTKKGEKRVLIFDGHTTHKTVEFLQLCETYEILPFCFKPHTTHLCQPLDGKPFLTYKTHFRNKNNLIAQWGGIPGDKANFLRDIVDVRNKTFNPRLIRNSFKERGIFPTDGSSIIEAIQKTLPPEPVLSAPDLHAYGESTPPPNLSSSSVENTPPKSAYHAEKNEIKLAKIFECKDLTPKLKRNLKRVLHYTKLQCEELAMTISTLDRIEAVRAPRQRKITKREVPRLGDSGILTVRDANRSIADRKAKEELNKKKKADKAFKEAYGFSPPPFYTEDLSTALDKEN